MDVPVKREVDIMKLNFFHRRPRPPRATRLAIGMTVEFGGKLWTISGDNTYYSDAISLLLEPVKKVTNDPRDEHW
jgi:hypothetical protein